MSSIPTPPTPPHFPRNTGNAQIPTASGSASGSMRLDPKRITGSASQPTHDKRDKPAGDALRFERRGAGRHYINGSATALRYEYRQASVAKHISPLELVDISDQGLGAVSQDAIALETPMDVIFPAHGPEHGIDVHGIVVRCVKMSDGRHSVGIRFDRKPAA